MVIGILKYLEKTTQPDIVYAVHQYSRFCEQPKLFHKHEVHKILRYLKATKDRGIIFKPNKEKELSVMQMQILSGIGTWSKEIILLVFFPDRVL